MPVSHDGLDLSSCEMDKVPQYHVPDVPMLPFPQPISLQQKCTHHIPDENPYNNYHRSTVQAKKKFFVTFYHNLLNEI